MPTTKAWRINPIGIGLTLLGTAGAVSGSFLPLREWSFRGIRDNSLVARALGAGS